jgi:hypothetical protein
MNTRWVDASELEPRRSPFWLSPLFFVIVAFGVLLALLVVGVLIYNRDSGDPLREVSIADLRADPERYDGDKLELSGTAEDVRTIPYLDQYGIYTLRDDSGSLLVLSRHGAPPTGEPVTVTGTYHGALKLDAYLKSLIDDQLGPLAGTVVEGLLPGIPLNVVFIEHEKYELADGE